MRCIMKVLLIIIIAALLTGCYGVRYSGLRLWAPDDPDHGQICGIKDWETNKVIPVNAIADDDWDHTDWDWVSREGCSK